MFDECDHVDGLHPGDVLFLNWESINKDNAVMIRDNEQNRTLYELIRKTKIEQHLPVVVIIDEEHMFAGRNARKSEMVLQALQPHIRTSCISNASHPKLSLKLCETPRSNQ